MKVKKKRKKGRRRTQEEDRDREENRKEEEKEVEEDKKQQGSKMYVYYTTMGVFIWHENEEVDTKYPNDRPGKHAMKGKGLTPIDQNLCQLAVV